MLRTALFATVLCASSCQLTPAFNVMPRFTHMSLQGSFGVASGGATGSSSTNDLGLVEENLAAFPQAEVSWGGAHLTVNALDTFYEGQGTVQADMDLDGVTLASGENVDSAFDMQMASAVMTWDMIPTDLAELGLGMGVTYTDVFTNVTSQSNPTQFIQTEEAAPIPVLALRAGTSLGPVLLSGAVSGLDLGFDDNEFSLTDFDLNASLPFFKGIRLRGYMTLGYRELTTRAQYSDSVSDVDLDFELGGPYFGIVLTL